MISDHDDIVLSSDCRFQLSLSSYHLHMYLKWSKACNIRSLTNTLDSRRWLSNDVNEKSIWIYSQHNRTHNSHCKGADNKIVYEISHRTHKKWLHKAVSVEKRIIVNLSHWIETSARIAIMIYLFRLQCLSCAHRRPSNNARYPISGR